MKFFLLFMILLTGCGEQIRNDARFNPMVAQFAKDAKFFGRDVDVRKVRISFDDIHAPMKILGFKIKIRSEKDGAEAYCSYLKRDVHNDIGKAFSKTFNSSSYDYMVIKLDNSLKDASIDHLESIVYHELGHCVLDLNHNENEEIMSSTANYSLQIFRYFYVKQLFLHQSLPPSIKGFSGNSNQSELIYQSDYTAFGKRMFYQLFFDHQKNEYSYNDNPEFLYH